MIRSKLTELIFGKKLFEGKLDFLVWHTSQPFTLRGRDLKPILQPATELLWLLCSEQRNFPDKPIDSTFGEISHFIFNFSGQACTATLSCHLPPTFVQFCSLDYRRKEVTGSHLPSLLLLLQKQSVCIKMNPP